MGYQSYASPRHEKVARFETKRKNRKNRFVGRSKTGTIETADKSDMLLATEIRNANERHKGDPAMLQAIDNKVKEFTLNRTIARDLGDRETEKELTAKLSKYLNSI